MANQGLLIGGVAVLGVAAYLLTQKEEEVTTLEDTQATSFVGISGGGEADNRTEKVESPTNFLEDCATPTTTDSTTDSTTDGGIECVVPLYLANETIRIEHPLAATNSDFAQYYFTVSIQSTMMTTMTESAFNSAPASQMLGDYDLDIDRSGGWQPDRRWTANQNADFSGSLSEVGLITKGNANDPVSSVVPTWEQCLNAFGGYMPNKVGALGDKIYFRTGSSTGGGRDFSDVGKFRYVKQGADGEPYPVTVTNWGLSMDGSVIPMFAQMEVKCSSGDWIVSGSPVQVTSANTLTEGDECSSQCFPAVLPTSGVALGCDLPTVSISYPSRIYVVCHTEVEDCSGRNKSSAGGYVPDEIWNLNPAITVPTTMQKGGWQTDSGRVWGILFNTYGMTPKIYQDAQGWYVKFSNSNNKTYINSILPGFKAAYTRQSVECECPSDTMLEGTKFTLLDKFSCPSGGILGGVFGGSTEWKTTYCGGLKPDYGCTDPRATNYNENKVKDPTDNDVCNPKYCNYGFNQILPECQGGGGLGGGGLGDIGGGGLAPAPKKEDDETDETPASGGTGGVGGGMGGGFGGSVGGFNLMAENILKPNKLVNTSHSFLNW